MTTEVSKADFLIAKIDNDWHRNMTTIGYDLRQLKLELPYGEFCEWVDRHLPFNRQTASRYMRMSRESDVRVDAEMNAEWDEVHKPASVDFNRKDIMGKDQCIA